MYDKLLLKTNICPLLDTSSLRFQCFILFQFLVLLCVSLSLCCIRVCVLIVLLVCVSPPRV